MSSKTQNFSKIVKFGNISKIIRECSKLRPTLLTKIPSQKFPNYKFKWTKTKILTKILYTYSEIPYYLKL